MKMHKNTHKSAASVAGHNAHAPHPSHRKVFDVMRPGKAPASPSSRPVIVGHTPSVADDQFVRAVAPSDVVAPGAPRLPGNAPEKRELLSHKEPPALAAPATPNGSNDPAPTVGDLASAGPVDAAPQGIQDGAQNGDISSAATAPLTAHQPAAQAHQAAIKIADDGDLSHEASSEGQAPTAPDPSTPPTSVPQDTTAIQHLATEQVVNAADIHNDSPEAEQSSAEADSTAAPSPSPITSGNPDGPRPKTIDELLAETGAPDLEPTNQPPQKTIISHHAVQHRHRALKWFLAFLILLVIAAATADILLDAGFITTNLNIPHTHLF